MILVSMFPALMAATIWITIPMVGAPITLQTLFVLLAGLTLSKKEAFLSMTIYLLLGAIGLPVFSGFTSGFGVLFGPTGGFLLAFPIVAYWISSVKEMINKYSVMVVGTIFIYAIGVPWLSQQLDWPLTEAVLAMTVYIPGDIIKIIVSGLVYDRIKLYI